VQNGALLPLPIHELRYFELVDLVHGNVPQGQKRPVGPHGARERVDTLALVNGDLDPVIQARLALLEALASLDDHPFGRDVDAPALVRKAIDVLNDREIELPAHRQTTFHDPSSVNAQREKDGARRLICESWLAAPARAK
jgi:hypothetical protein